MSPKHMLARLFRRTKNKDTTVARHRRTTEPTTVRPAAYLPSSLRETTPVPPPVIPEPKPVSTLTPADIYDVNVMRWFTDDDAVTAWAETMLKQRRSPETIAKGFLAYVLQHPITA